MGTDDKADLFDHGYTCGRMAELSDVVIYLHQRADAIQDASCGSFADLLRDVAQAMILDHKHRGLAARELDLASEPQPKGNQS